MTKILIVGRNLEEAEALFKPYASSVSVVREAPDMVASYGGDGTLMEAEFLYPGIPKLFLKNSRIAKLAQKKDNETIVAHVARGEYTIIPRSKIEAIAKGQTLIGLNDIIVHNADPRTAIRYKTEIDGVLYSEKEIIGDGVVVSTPLGSTGYYRSITDSYFETGIGLAFNNSTEQSDHVVLNDARSITITITRGPAQCYADNQEQSVSLDDGDSVVIRKSAAIANIVVT